MISLHCNAGFTVAFLLFFDDFYYATTFWQTECVPNVPAVFWRSCEPSTNWQPVFQVSYWKELEK